MGRLRLRRGAIVTGLLLIFACFSAAGRGQTGTTGPRVGIPLPQAAAQPQFARRSVTPVVRTLPSTDTRLGINLPELGPQPSDMIVFVDAMKQAALWSSLRPLRTDAEGNVAVLAAGQTAETSIVTKQLYPPGDYTLLYDGRGRISIPGAILVQYAPGRMVARFSQARQSIYLQLSAVDPSDYVRNVRLILPGFEATYATHPFHPAFVAAMQRFHVLRFKGWERADSYAASATWSNRPTVSRMTQAGADGVAPEYLIALANATGDDPWFTLPLGATDYYIAQFARLVHASLDPRLHPIFEYGHEVWRIGSLGNGYAQMAGRNFRLSNDPQTAALHWYSSRSTQAFNIIERNFGFDARRVVRVLSGPLGPAGSAQAAVDREILRFADAAGSADAFAVAAQDAAGGQGPAAATPANRFARIYALPNSLGSAASYASAVLNTAGMLGVQRLFLFAYQGPSATATSGRNALEALQAAQRTRMSFGASLESWHGYGGGLFVGNFDESMDQAMRNGMQQYRTRHPLPHLAPPADLRFIAPLAPESAPRAHQVRATLFGRSFAMSAGTTLTYHPGTLAAPSQLFYTVPGESGAISRQMDPTAVGGLTNETITYQPSTQISSWGWVSGPNEPQLTLWPATTYIVSLNVTQPNASLQLQRVRVFRTDSTGGPQYTGLATIAALNGLTQSLGTAGVLTFMLPGGAQNANSSDRLAVKFDVRNFSSTAQSFSYDAGAGTLSGVATGFAASPPPSPSPTPTPTPTPTPAPTPSQASTYRSTILADAPASYYRLDEASGTTIADSSGHGVTGTLSGTAGYNVAGALIGDSDGAMSFNGSNTYLTASSAPLGSRYSLEVWIKTSATAEGHIIDMSPQQLYLANGKFEFGTGGGHYLGSPAAGYNNNQYHQVVATFDGTTKRLYIDGALVASVADTAMISGSVLNVGRYSGGGFLFSGSVDEVALYTSVLSASQVTNHFNAARGATATPTPTPSIPDITTFHVDNARSGWNPREVALTTANVASSSFGQVGQIAVDGQVLAQPLFVGQYQVPGKGTHNLVVVATEHNSLYAFDADTLQQMWHTSFGQSQSATDIGCPDIVPEYGITSTPVINRTGAGSGTIYLVAATEPSSLSYHTQLHAVDIGTGVDQATPTEINPSALLTNGSMIHFDAKDQMSRTGLFMWNGSVYVGIGSHCDFTSVPVTGWMIRYNAALQQTAAFNTEDDSAGNSLASVWMAGYASALDASGNIYFATGNGPYDANTGGKNYGESVLKLSSDLSTVASYFTPQNYASLNDADLDLGSGGVMVIPGSTDLIARGKDGRLFLLSQTSLGGFQNNDAGALQIYSSSQGVWGGPAYYVGPTGIRYVYSQGDFEPMRAFVFNGSQLSLASSAADNGGYGGSSPVVSSNGSQSGTGILWVAQRGSTVHLEAYDATNMQSRLFLGSAGTWPNPENNPFVSPLVANGRVYVGASGTVTVFGLH